MDQFFPTKFNGLIIESLGNRLIKKIALLLLPLILLIGHSAMSQCTFASSFGSATINTSGAVVTISTCSFAGEYSTISGATNGQTIKFTSSVSTDFITVHSGSSNGPVIAFGQTPLTFANTFTGTIYSHWSTDAACGTQSSCRTTTVQCTVCAPPPPAPCTNASSFGSATINASGSLVTISGCSFAGEYSTISGAVSGQSLQFTSSVATDFITIHSGTPGGPVVAYGTTPLSFPNTFTGTLYAHWNTPGCGSQSACRTTTVQCTSCTPCLPVTITPAAPTICAGSVQLLTATHNNPASQPDSLTTSSGPVNLLIPDNTSVSNTMPVSNIPASGVVTGVSVTFNINHTWDSDLTISLKSPNNQVINMVNARGGSGDNFTNTTISSSSVVSLGTGTSPFTGIFAADANAALPPTGFTQTTTTFTPMFTTPNGNWGIGLRDNASGDQGTLLDWSVKIYFNAQAQPVWAPLTELYTDPAGTIPYTGTPSATVYAAPTVTRTYTATLVTGSCTPTPASVTVTTNPAPAAPTILPNPAVACPGGILQLNASTGPGGSTGSCSTGSGTIAVNIPDNTPAGITSNLVVNCVPPTATVTGVDVTINITHTWDADMIINLKAPNNQVLNLINARGGSGDNFTNTVISSASSTSLSTGTPPFTGTFMADGNAANPPTAYPQTTATFPPLFTIANGTWTLAMRDNAAGDLGILTSWSILINYSLPPAPVAVIWAPTTDLYTDAAATVAYTGTALSTIYVKPSAARTYTAVIPSAPCPSLPAIIPVTLSPNPNVVIIADPGSVLCEGDPALLTVRIGSSSPIGTLYTQGTTPIDGSPSQVFEPANTAFNSQSADDFTVPAGTTWTVTQVNAAGIGAGTPTSLNVFFYNNSGANLPGSVVASYNNITTYTQAGGTYNVTLPTSLILAPGTYWVSVQVNMSFATGGQWFWGNYGTTNVGNQYAWQNPGGGFGTPCSGWGYGATGCGVGGGVNRNNIFTIIGSSLADGGPLPGGYTFLWSPAAGLSSTTSNPVAASPINTTTYTVTTTTGFGCVNSANILITVNKRPTVTVQPVSQVNCSGTTATFTVGGTGTGLTYQWQQSVTGVGGPWTNLTNIAPYGGATGPVLTINPVSGVMNGYAYRCVLSGTCAAIGTANISNAVLLTVNPLPNVSITPPVSCGGVAGIYGTQLSVNSSAPPIPGNVSASSGAISVVIPDGTGVAAISTLNIAGVPANATITQVKITMNMNHTWVGDVDVNIKSPNAAILNLVGGLDGGTGGNSSDNFTNTAFSSLGGATISGAAAPRTGTYAAEARVGYGPTGYIQAAPATWGGLTPTATSANGVWTLAMGDWAGGDQGTLTSWSISIDYTTPGSGGGPTLTYVWSPLAGLYNNSTATVAYTGTNTPTVYAAPTAQTVYTVTATDVATGCVGTATALVNYTPPAPTITPSSVTMCLGDPAVMLKSSSSQAYSATFNSGAMSLAIPDGPATWPQTLFPGVSTPNLPVSGIPANATITGMSVKLNLTHTYIADMVIVLKAPNGAVLNLDANISRTGGAGANFVNTIISSASSTALSAGAPPYTGTFKPDAVGATYTAVGFTFPGGPTTPAGYIPTVSSFSGLYSVPNGNWTLGIYDWGAGDLGTLTNWELKIDYIIGVPATPAVWTPAAGLYSNASATTPYVAGTAVDSVWTRPTPSGVYNYQATVQNIITNNSTIATPMAGGNGNNLVAFNVRNNNATPINFNSISSNTFGSGAVVSRVFYKAAPIAGNPGPISAANGWIQFGTANNTVTAGSLNLLMSGLTLSIPAGATYGIALDMTGATFPAYTNGTGTIQTYSNNNVDLITDGNVGWGGPAAPGTPANNPRNFNGSIDLGGSGPGTCTSPARTVVVTVKDPTTVVTQPVNQTICTDKVATFTVAGGGSGPFSYQWQVSTNGGNPPWTNVANGGVYSGATSATLTITAPPVSMSGYQYRCVITGAAPCAAATSFSRILTVNPLPVVVISASPYTSLLPGLVTTLSSTVSPNAAASYSWLHDGASVPGANTGSLSVDVDGLGDYQLSVIDVNGCTSSSNIIKIKDSASGKCFIYPNPTNGQFQVRYYSVANNVLPRSLTVYDAKGDRVFTKFYTIGRPYDRMDVDMRAYGKGLYWVEIGDLNGNRITMCRVVIQ